MYCDMENEILLKDGVQAVSLGNLMVLYNKP